MRPFAHRAAEKIIARRCRTPMQREIIRALPSLFVEDRRNHPDIDQTVAEAEDLPITCLALELLGSEVPANSPAIGRWDQEGAVHGGALDRNHEAEHPEKPQG